MRSPIPPPPATAPSTAATSARGRASLLPSPHPAPIPTSANTTPACRAPSSCSDVRTGSRLGSAGLLGDVVMLHRFLVRVLVVFALLPIAASVAAQTGTPTPPMANN